MEPIRLIWMCHSQRNGLGGHHFSVIDLATTVAPPHESVVVSIGPSTNPAFDALGLPHVFIENNVLLPQRIYSNFKRVRKLALESPRTVLLPLDFQSLECARLACAGLDLPIIHVKPGGPNWEIPFRNLSALVAFSVENLEDLKRQSVVPEEYLKLIPQRVRGVEIDSDRRNEFRALFKTKRIILSIARIVRSKNSIFWGALQYYENLLHRGERASLCFLGIPLEEDFLQELKVAAAELVDKYVHADIIFLTTPKYFRYASRWFCGCDLLIGNGRTVLEGLSAGIPCAIPVMNCSCPILIDSQSFPYFAEGNMSWRSKVPAEVIANAEWRLDQVIADSEAHQVASRFSRQIFESDYDAKEGVRRYLEIAEFCLQGPRQTSRFSLHEFIRFIGQGLIQQFPSVVKVRRFLPSSSSSWTVSPEYNRSTKD